MKKRTKRVLLVLVILLVVLVAGTVGLVVADVLPDPRQPAISQEEAARRADEYILEHYPELAGKRVSSKTEYPSWEFGYRTEVTVEVDGTTETFARVVIVSVDKRTGELHTGVSD
jgi:hypothetical protein